MKTKMKTKLVVSICALTLIFTACKKDTVTPVPVLDCNGIENGTAIEDSCGVCQQAYLYNTVSHVVVFLDDTAGVIASDTAIIIMPNNSINPSWNASCVGCTDSTAFNYDPNATEDNGSCCMIAGCMDSLASNFDQNACYDDSSCTYDASLDCMGIENGVAALDTCGTCHQSYIYDFATHTPTYINDTTGLALGATEMLILAGSAEDIVSNPNWNGGPLGAIDDCGDCHSSYIYDFATHTTTDINDTAGLVLGATEMLILAGSPEDIGNNPNWNAGCK